MPQRLHLSEIPVGTRKETRHRGVSLHEPRITDHDLQIQGVEPGSHSLQVRRLNAGKLIVPSLRRFVAGHAVEFVQKNQTSLGQVVIVIKATVETLKPDHERIVHRLRMSRMSFHSSDCPQQEREQQT